uniref:Uncharacterized protein n=1 Tax=Anguilla anguilla TaxID=7936 RepID=A0A0E9VKH9_ANGAN
MAIANNDGLKGQPCLIER